MELTRGPTRSCYTMNEALPRTLIVTPLLDRVVGLFLLGGFLGWREIDPWTASWVLRAGFVFHVVLCIAALQRSWFTIKVDPGGLEIVSWISRRRNRFRPEELVSVAESSHSFELVLRFRDGPRVIVTPWAIGAMSLRRLLRDRGWTRVTPPGSASSGEWPP
jgi:hypothetical protein